MSSARRTPLANNPNIANSPLRVVQAPTKLKRPFATVQREEQYGHPPPKKQIVEHGAQRPVQSRAVQLATAIHRGTASRERVARQQSATTAENNLDEWRRHHKSRFPKMVFYFESLPAETHGRLVRGITKLGAREEKFFSIEVTHVVTTRPIPSPTQKPEPQQEPEQRDTAAANDEPMQTINPSLLDRSTEARRRMMFELGTRRQQAQQPSQDEAVRRAKGARHTDVLCKAHDMGKKIWSLDKFQKVLYTLLDGDSHATHTGGASRSAGLRSSRKVTDENDLRQLLRQEQLAGPSDRLATEYRDIISLKGFYIYVYDMDEKQKPMMVREYPKVSRWMEGEWPQFRSVTQGRCPFVEEEPSERRPRVLKAPERMPVLRPTEAVPAKMETRKRELADLVDNSNNRSRPPVAIKTHLLEPTQSSVARQIDFCPFTGRTANIRQVAGEPVASGMQPSNLTSAIQSQMISSTSGTAGTKAGTSKEVYDLQRKVLQKTTQPSRHAAAMDAPSSKPSVLERARTMGAIDQISRRNDSRPPGLDRRASAPHPQGVKREPKPGYCENCADKFRDFDEHILSRNHRRFADSDTNFVELDELLHELQRQPKRCLDLE